jgi:hypothetical protein
MNRSIVKFIRPPNLNHYQKVSLFCNFSSFSSKSFDKAQQITENVIPINFVKMIDFGTINLSY